MSKYFLIGFIVTLAILSIGVVALRYGNNEQIDIQNKDCLDCMETLKHQLTNPSTTSIELKLSTAFTCFNWDSIEFKDAGFYKNRPDVNYCIIRDLKFEEHSRLDWLEGDKGWYYIYFYEGDVILNYAIAVPHVILDAQNLVPLSNRKFNKESMVLRDKQSRTGEFYLEDINSASN